MRLYKLEFIGGPACGKTYPVGQPRERYEYGDLGGPVGLHLYVVDGDMADGKARAYYQGEVKGARNVDANR